MGPSVFNVYCDESCHLENDRQSAMTLGALWLPMDLAMETNKQIRRIKIQQGIDPHSEVKWVKLAPGNLPLYETLVNYFFDFPQLHFRVLIVPDKAKLRHDRFRQDHDTWYYKMYFDLLKVILYPKLHYRIFIDIKDTHMAERIATLHDILCNNMYDFDREILEKVQAVRSHEIELLQLADILIGAVSYANRGLSGNKGKERIVELIRRRSGYELTKSTLLRENKMSIFRWQALEVEQ